MSFKNLRKYRCGKGRFLEIELLVLDRKSLQIVRKRATHVLDYAFDCRPNPQEHFLRSDFFANGRVELFQDRQIVGFPRDFFRVNADFFVGKSKEKHFVRM